MKVTVVTPLFRVHNVETIYTNIATVLKGMDWQWMPVLDMSSPEASLIEAMDARAGGQIVLRHYQGGDRWASSIARNQATEITDGWIINLDDDCLLHDNAGHILKIVSSDVPVVTWQTLDSDGGVRNFPNAGKLSGADTNAFAYQRQVMECGTWDVRADADVYYFHKIRSLFPIAYFQIPGAWWNVNP